MKQIHALIITLGILLLTAASVTAQKPSSRLIDIAHIEGARSNQLVGYGLVVGLDGTGDSQQTIFTAQSVANMLVKFGIKVSATTMKTKNVAAVMVTADLPPFQRPGSKIDIVVSSLGDAKTLQGGTLLQAPLQGADGNIYAVAQGSIAVGGFFAGSGGSSSNKNHTLVGRIPNGAIVERPVPTTLSDGKTINVLLDSPDFQTAAHVAEAINESLGKGSAVAKDAATIQVNSAPDNMITLIAKIGDIQVVESSTAKVIVNERTGTVVIGGSVKLSPAAIAHGNLSIEVSSQTQSQVAALPGGKVVEQSQTQSTVKSTEQSAHMIYMQPGNSLQDLVHALNELKVTPRDVIAILQSLKQAGALHADLEII